MMLENRWLFATAHLLTRSETWKVTENSVFFPASVAILFASLLTACSSNQMSDRSELPDHISQLENLTVYDPDIQPADTVVLTRETIFESNEEVFMGGYIHHLAIDAKGYVYISSTRPGFVGIYVFNPDGSYVTSFSQHGRGPAEYESISSMSIVGENLYLFDTRLQKIGIFSIDGFKHIRDLLIDQSQLKENNVDYSQGMIANKLIVRKDGSFLVRLKSRPRNDPSFQHKEVYFKADENGKLLPTPYIQVDSHTYYFPDEQLSLPFPGAFSRSSLVAVGNDGRFYTNWTEDFIIQVYNSDGEYEKAYKHQIQKENLNIEELYLDRNMESTLNKYDLPQTWPAVHTMELDDEGRHWVATITDSESEFLWWVLNKEGEVIARFRKEGVRSNRTVIQKPIITIKNGYFYSHERNFNEGIDRIVKYRMEFREAE